MSLGQSLFSLLYLSLWLCDGREVFVDPSVVTIGRLRVRRGRAERRRHRRLRTGFIIQHRRDAVNAVNSTQGVTGSTFKTRSLAYTQISEMEFGNITRISLLLLFLAAGMEIKLSKNNDHDGVSHGVECSREGDRIPPLKSNRQVLEQEHRLSCVLRDCRDVSTNFLDQLYGGLAPGTGSFNCHWQKDARGVLQAKLCVL